MADVKIYFVTNRNAVITGGATDFGAHFNPDGVAALRFGTATFDVTNDVASNPRLTVYPDAATPPGTTTVAPAGSGSFLEDVRQQMTLGRDTLVFIHGFDVSFDDALQRGALVAAKLPNQVNVVVFSWPSDGTAVPFMSYYSDRDDARASGPALARVYLKLFDFVEDLRAKERNRQLATGQDDKLETDLCMRCIHVLAHSMGNYVLRHGIQAIRAKDPRKMVRMFDQVIMAAADEDDDTFESDDKLRLLPSMARRITVYHNRNDRALVISDRTKANPDRLGSEGPRMLDMLPKKVIVVDCSRVAAAADPRGHHSYYIHSPSVTADIASVLEDTDDAQIGNREVIRPERSYRIEA